jgi:hypothetical protein
MFNQQKITCIYISQTLKHFSNPMFDVISLPFSIRCRCHSAVPTKTPSKEEARENATHSWPLGKRGDDRYMPTHLSVCPWVLVIVTKISESDQQLVILLYSTAAKWQIWQKCCFSDLAFAVVNLVVSTVQKLYMIKLIARFISLINTACN